MAATFVRVKSAGSHRYLQVVENHRERGRTVQHVIGTLGRLDQLTAAGEVDGLIRSLARFADQVRVVAAQAEGRLQAGPAVAVGPNLVFGRLWEQLGIGAILQRMLQRREFEFPVERAVYLTVLHRLFESGSDRQAERWRRDVQVPGAEALELHHLYRAMRWLGENKDDVEEELFARRRDLLTEVTLAFFDTTTLYFHGQGGQFLGWRGHSKEGRNDLRQMVVGAVLTGDGRPVSCEFWPGNHSDQRALLPVVDRARQRFGLHQVCWVADRGMISEKTIAALEERKLRYILGARMRRQKEVKEKVLSRAGRYREVAPNLHVKEVWVGEHRYVVCFNPDEAAKEAADRQAILAAVEDKLREGAGSLVGNRGFRRFLRVDADAVRIDPKKVEADARYDGKFVLRTNTDLPADEVALQYKRLLLVESFFRAVKSMLESRPIYHKWDATIAGHVFCSFLALVLFDELQRRLADRGFQVEWADVRRDLAALEEMEVRDGHRCYRLRTPLQGVAGKVLQAVGVAIPRRVQTDSPVVPSTLAVPSNPRNDAISIPGL